MNVYVFPTQGQASSQQSKDEAECYTWAVQNTGTDPFQLQKQASHSSSRRRPPSSRPPRSAGSAREGRGGGAATGALIGAIAGRRRKGRGDRSGERRGRRAAGAQAQEAARAAGRAAVGEPPAGDGAADGELQEGLQRLPRGQEVHGQVLTMRRLENERPPRCGGFFIRADRRSLGDHSALEHLVRDRRARPC